MIRTMIAQGNDAINYAKTSQWQLQSKNIDDRHRFFAGLYKIAPWVKYQVDKKFPALKLDTLRDIKWLDSLLEGGIHTVVGAAVVIVAGGALTAVAGPVIAGAVATGAATAVASGVMKKREGSARGMKYRLIDLGKDGSEWRHGYIPLNAQAVALKEHHHPSSSGAPSLKLVRCSNGWQGEGQQREVDSGRLEGAGRATHAGGKTMTGTVTAQRIGGTDRHATRRRRATSRPTERGATHVINYDVKPGAPGASIEHSTSDPRVEPLSDNPSAIPRERVAPHVFRQVVITPQDKEKARQLMASGGFSMTASGFKPLPIYSGSKPTEPGTNALRTAAEEKSRVDFRNGGDKPEGPYMVSLDKAHGGNEVRIPGHATAAQIAEHRASVEDLLTSHPGMYHGGWYDPDENATYLDISKAHADKADALKAARENHQLAIYDVTTGNSISAKAKG